MSLGDGADVDSRMPVAGEVVPSPDDPCRGIHVVRDGVEMTLMSEPQRRVFFCLRCRKVIGADGVD